MEGPWTVTLWRRNLANKFYNEVATINAGLVHSTGYSAYVRLDRRGDILMLKITTLAGIAAWVLMTASAPLYAAGTPIEVSLGDVSINKVPFLIAADTGIYVKNALDVHQFITPGAAAVAEKSGVVVPPEYVKSGMNPPITVGGGSPMIVDTVNKPGAIAHVIVATNEAIVRDHVLANSSIKSLKDL